MDLSDVEWAEGLRRAEAWVFHVPTGTVGKVTEVWDGGARQYVSPVTKEPVSAPVIVLDSGASHVLKRELFTELSKGDAVYFALVMSAVADTARRAATTGVALKVDPELAVMLIRCAFDRQAASLQKASA